MDFLVRRERWEGRLPVQCERFTVNPGGIGTIAGPWRGAAAQKCSNTQKEEAPKREEKRRRRSDRKQCTGCVEWKE